MPVHRALHGQHMADSLSQLLAQVENAREKPVLVQNAGNEWVVYTERKPGRPPRETRPRKAQETR